VAKPTFVLPRNLRMDQNERGMSVAYDGDVVIQQTFGKRLRKVRAGGNCLIQLDEVRGDIKADGKLRVRGDVRARRLRGTTVRVDGRRLRAGAIIATERIVLAVSELDADLICAPEIRIDPRCGGRVGLVVCEGDPPRTQCAMGTGDPDLIEAAFRRHHVPIPTWLEAQDEEIDFADSDLVEDPTLSRSLSSELAEQSTADRPGFASSMPDHALNFGPGPVGEAGKALVEAYGDTKVPSPIRELAQLVRTDPKDAVARLPWLWEDALREHLREGTHPPATAGHYMRVLRARLR